MTGVSQSSVSGFHSRNHHPRVKVRKRGGRPALVILIAIFFMVTSLKSTWGGSSTGGTKDGNEKRNNKISETIKHHQQNHQGQHHQMNHEEKGAAGNKLKDEKGWPVTEKNEEEREMGTEEGTDTVSGTTPESATFSPNSSPKPTKESSTGNVTEGTQSTTEFCVPPAIEQFPRPMLGQNIRKHGGFLLYLVIAAYTFLALAIVCDEFFVPSLDIICELLKISPDVAGATFMAAGSSAPELATALIGVFVAKDDIGVSGVIGSAVFNIMFVISICSLLTPTVLYLNWWPMFRDCFFYMVSIIALLFAILDEEIEWYESIVFLFLYGVYIYAMYMNTVLEAWAHTLPIPFPVVQATVPDENSGLVTYKSAQKSDHGATASGGENIIVEGLDPTLSANAGGMGASYTDAWGDGVSNANVGSIGMQPSPSNPGEFPEGVQQNPPKKVAPQAESILSHLNPPPESSLLKKILWRASSPLIYLFYYTVPDCRLEAWKTWYIVTFVVSMVWIAIFSYVMVWMITVVGFTAGIPDTVMGLTFVAAGVSVPDALSSLAVVKEGYGDMAVSNAIGSNVFDILICLGLPWFLSTVIVHPGESVKVISKGLTYSTFSLLSTVAFLLLATHYNGWKLDKKYGILLMLWYLFFMVFASLYELNIFGNFNPPECFSEY